MINLEDMKKAVEQEILKKMVEIVKTKNMVKRVWLEFEIEDLDAQLEDIKRHSLIKMPLFKRVKN